MNDSRPLCLSFWTPPVMRPQAILIGKMIPEWIRQGVRPVLITYDTCGKWDIDAKIYTIPEHKPNKILRHLPIVRAIVEIIYFKKIAKTIKKIVKDNNINIIFSFSNPQDSNIIGAIIKKETGIKFVSHFCDPWYDNPYKAYSMIGYIKVFLYESFITKYSDKIIFTNESAKKLVLKKFPKKIQDKGEVVPHCYDEKEYPADTTKTPKFVISHIGAFYKERNPELLLRSIGKIVSDNPNIKKKVIIKLVGAANPYAGYHEKDIKELALKYGIEEITEIIPAVSYKESLKYMKDSDCLIVIDANFKESPFLPSKVVDYAGSKKTIIGITPKDSPTSKFLEEIGYKTFSYSEETELVKYINTTISRAEPDNIAIGRNDKLEKYSVQSTTTKLFNIFREILK